MCLLSICVTRGSINAWPNFSMDTKARVVRALATRCEQVCRKDRYYDENDTREIELIIGSFLNQFYRYSSLSLFSF